jgi:hypothetical protein
MSIHITARAGKHISAWSFCDRCGWPYRLPQMGMQNGLLLCFEHCYDNPDSYIMPVIRTEVLEDVGTELQNMTAIKRADTNNNMWDDF